MSLFRLILLAWHVNWKAIFSMLFAIGQEILTVKLYHLDYLGREYINLLIGTKKFVKKPYTRSGSVVHSCIRHLTTVTIVEDKCDSADQQALVF